ncbi:MAG: NEW3 domain-containing protein [Candidatus Diapherotrites archaeon]
MQSSHVIRLILIGQLFAMLSIVVFAVTNVDPYYLLNIDSTLQKPTVIYPGNTVNLAVNLVNVGLYTDANDVKLKLLLPEGFPQSFVETTIPRIKPKEKKTVVFVFPTSKTISSGTYTLTLQMNYKNGTIDVLDSKYLNITVSDIYDISISNIKVSDYFPHIGDKIIITADIQNNGSLEARNVYCEISMLSTNPFVGFITQSDVRQELGNIAVGESKRVTFEIMASEVTNPGTYAFKLTTGCMDCNTKMQMFSIHLYGRPQLIISGIDYSINGRNDKKIMQGDTISLAIQLENLGKESAKRVVVSIENDSSLIGSKSSYIGEIKSEDSGSAIFDLSVDSNAAIGYHDINITIKYLDELQKEQMIKTSYSIYVSKAPEPSPYLHYVFIIVILAMVYIIIRLIIRQLALRKL